jgi:hypothetical protein
VSGQFYKYAAPLALGNLVSAGTGVGWLTVQIFILH